MNALAIINKYYSEENELKHILLTHSRSVADKALQIAVKHPELHLDTGFLEEAALLHDIGIFMTDASGIQCFGTHPYICHGYLGSELLMKEGYPRHALVICFADKFFSKTHLDREKSVEKALKSISRYGEDGVIRFKHWCECFL